MTCFPTPGAAFSQQHEATVNATNSPLLDDIVDEGLDVIFVGINPGLQSAMRGHSFATPGNRMWTALHRSGFTPYRLRPEQERDLLHLGLGLTTIVRTPTVRASDLTRDAYLQGGEDLLQRMEALRPTWLAFLGVTGYRTAFGVRDARVGPQTAVLGESQVWVLPNPSGRNAHYPPVALAAEFARLRVAAHLPDRAAGTPPNRPRAASRQAPRIEKKAD